MIENKIYYGTLEKTETLRPVEILGVQDALVYESLSPFFGYYDDYPGKHNDNAYYYLVLEGRKTFAEMHRVILKANNALNIKVNMNHATLCVNHNTYTAVRLRYLEEVENVAIVKKVLADLGFKFYNGKAKGESTCETKIVKYFDLEYQGDGVWIDNVAGHHAYLQLPGRVEMNEFRALVQRVRNNWDGNVFDAGLGVFSTQDEVIEVVRVYSKSINEEGYLQELKKVFNSVF